MEPPPQRLNRKGNEGPPLVEGQRGSKPGRRPCVHFGARQRDMLTSFAVFVLLGPLKGLSNVRNFWWNRGHAKELLPEYTDRAGELYGIGRREMKIKFPLLD